MPRPLVAARRSRVADAAWPERSVGKSVPALLGQYVPATICDLSCEGLIDFGVAGGDGFGAVFLDVAEAGFDQAFA